MGNRYQKQDKWSCVSMTPGPATSVGFCRNPSLLVCPGRMGVWVCSLQHQCYQWVFRACPSTRSCPSFLALHFVFPRVSWTAGLTVLHAVSYIGSKEAGGVGMNSWHCNSCSNLGGPCLAIKELFHDAWLFYLHFWDCLLRIRSPPLRSYELEHIERTYQHSQGPAGKNPS